MKNKTMEQMRPLLAAQWGTQTAGEILRCGYRRLEALCRENEADPKPVKMHRERNIFPCISLYEALQAHGIPQAEALEFLDRSWSQRAQAGADSNRKLLKIAGFYRLYPGMFRFVAKKQFGTAAGFTAKFYDTEKTRCKFDMTRCLFLETCRKYGCPELTACFCHVDDVNNANLHPRLCWNRTQYMGGGGDCCDFDIYVTAPEKKNR